jgi:energy-coupling factor transporter ATP-binding protein EcfA2
VPQDGALFSKMTVAEQMGLALTIRRFRRGGQAAGRRIGRAAGDHHLLDRKPRGLSGGERQRVALGRALSFRPGVLCLDEPLSALDEETRAQMCSLLDDIRRRTGVTTLHITHNTHEADTLADCLIRLQNGRIESVTRLDTAIPTLAKQFKQAGYATAHFGKWHLGPEPFSPLQHGFDIDLPHHPGPGPAGSFVAPWTYNGGRFTPNEPKEHIEDRMAAEAVKWLQAQPDDQPFYLNYWQFSVHAPFDAKQELIDYYRPKIDRSSPQASPTYAAMVHSLDDAVGTLLDAIDAKGIADRTVIVFYSDNGGNMYNGIRETGVDGETYITAPTSNAPLRGGKATMFEGGIRVPCVICWPGVTEPGSRSDELIQTSDFYPTFLNQLGIAMPANHAIDGIDITPALKGGHLGPRGDLHLFPALPAVPTGCRLRSRSTRTIGS